MGPSLNRLANNTATNVRIANRQPAVRYVRFPTVTQQLLISWPMFLETVLLKHELVNVAFCHIALLICAALVIIISHVLLLCVGKGGSGCDVASSWLLVIASCTEISQVIQK